MEEQYFTLDETINEIIEKIEEEINNNKNINEIDQVVPNKNDIIQSITDLDLAESKLNGYITPSLSIFPNLKHLVLSRNKLCGKLEGNVFSLLPNLIYLDLSYNEFQEEISDSFYSSLKNIEYLNISFNKIKSNISPRIKEMSKIKILIANDNDFYGKLPDEFYELENLELINFDNNNIKHDKNLLLHGNIFSGIKRLKNLKILSITNHGIDNQEYSKEKLSINSIDFSPLKFLNNINLRGNDLVGTVPSSLFDIPFLTFLDLSDNQFDNIEPFSHENLMELNLSFNILSSFIIEKGGLPQLNRLSLQNNKLKEGLDIILSITSLVSLDISNNNFSTDLSLYINNIISLSKLKYLSLSHNDFKGKFFIPCDSNLLSINISNNKFNDINIDNINPLIEYFDISHNKFEFSLSKYSEYFNRMNNIRYFSISNNEFTGECIILKSDNLLSYIASNNKFDKIDFNALMEHCPNIKMIDLENNKIYTNIFPLKHKSKSLEVLKLGNNSIDGKIDETISYLEKLSYFSLNNNKMFGIIPKELFELEKLEFIDLSHNEFYGPLSNLREYIKKYKKICLEGNHYTLFKYLSREEYSKWINK